MSFATARRINLSRGNSGQRLQRGQAGELAAEMWFKSHGWHMVRTQPPVTIIGILTGPMVQMLSRFIPRLAHFGHMVIARMGKGGVVDYTGYVIRPELAIPEYRVCEVKEAVAASMPCSRLDKEQRGFMDGLPASARYVGVFWTDYGLFEIFTYREKGSYKKGEGIHG